MVHENPTYDKEVIKADPVDTVHKTANENPCLIDSSPENMSTTTWMYCEFLHYTYIKIITSYLAVTCYFLSLILLI